MKFTQQQAFENLKGKLTQGGKTLRMSERTINKQLEALIPLLTNDESELDDFVSKVFPAFQETNSNMEHDYAEFVKAYKAQDDKEKGKGADAKTDEAYIEMQNKLAELEKQVLADKKEKQLASIKNSLKSAMKEKGIKDDKWINKYLAETSITEDLDVQEKAKSALEFYNLNRAEIPDVVTPLSPSTKSTEMKDMWNDLKPKKE